MRTARPQLVDKKGNASGQAQWHGQKKKQTALMMEGKQYTGI